MDNKIKGGVFYVKKKFYSCFHNDDYFPVRYETGLSFGRCF